MRKHARGQALLEFALSLTVLLLLVGGVVDVARIYFSYQIVSDAAREGVTFAAMAAGNNTAITQRAIDSTTTLPLTADDVSITYSGNACANGSNRVTVTVSYDVPLRMPMTMSVLGDTVRVTASEEAVILAPECP